MSYAAHTFQLESLLLDGARYIVERVRGTAAVASRRREAQRVAYRHGTWDTGDPFADEKSLSLLISIHANDEYGLRPESPYFHLRENWDELAAVVGQRSLIDVRQFVPDLVSPVELQNFARVGSQIEITGDALVWMMDLEMIFPYPFWHELPQISRGSATSHAIAVGGSAPVADMVLTFAGDGTLSDDQGNTLSIAGSTGPVVVDVGAREVTQAGILAMSLLDEDTLSENWMEWPAQTTVNLTSDVGVAVDYFEARQ